MTNTSAGVPSPNQINASGNDHKGLTQPHEQDRNDRHENVLRVSNRQEIDIASALDAYAEGKENNQPGEKYPRPQPTKGNNKLLSAVGFRGECGTLLASQSHGTHGLGGE